MTRTVTPLPERLRTAGATDLEHRLLGAAARELPSQELTARMAAAIGVSAPAALARTFTARGNRYRRPGSSRGN